MVVVANLPADIVFSDILPRLPATSLIRLRVVCKTWNSVIREPAFARANLKHALRSMPDSCRIMFLDRSGNNGLVLLDEAFRRPKTVLTTGDIADVQVSPPCNGLVCIYRSHETGLWLFNLTTRELLPLPRPDDPCKLRTFYLGYDPSTNKYKVLCHAAYRSECQVLTVGSDTTWRRIAGTVVADSKPFISVAIGGFIFRLSADRVSVLLFGVREERFRRLSLPNSRIVVRNVIDIEGKASFVEQDPYSSMFLHGLHVWMLMDVDREVWTRRCIMPAVGGGLDQLQSRDYPHWMVWSTAALIFKDKVLLNYGCKFYCLHLRSDDGRIDCWEEVHNGSGSDMVLLNYHSIHPFVENLISLKGMLQGA